MFGRWDEIQALRRQVYTERFRRVERPAPLLDLNAHLTACDAPLRWLPRAPRRRVRIEGELRL